MSVRHDVRGRQAVEAAFSALAQEGLKFDAVSVDGADREALRDAVASADVFIDQLVVGWYGPHAVQAMARGKVVLAYIRDDLVAELPAGVLVNANPRTLAARLREVISDAALRAAVGAAARRFVEGYHASEVVAARLQELYRQANRRAGDAASLRAFAGAVDVSLHLSRCTERAAELESRASLPAEAPKAAAAKPAPAKPAPAVKKPATRPPRTLWQRLLNASPAKIANRIGRLLGRS